MASSTCSEHRVLNLPVGPHTWRISRAKRSDMHWGKRRSPNCSIDLKTIRIYNITYTVMGEGGGRVNSNSFMKYLFAYIYALFDHGQKKIFDSLPKLSTVLNTVV